MNFIENTFTGIFEKNPTNDDYYHASIKPIDKGFFISIFTIWDDYDESGKYEVRKADLVLPDKVVNDFRTLFNEKIAVVDTKEELLGLAHFGGHSIISKKLMDTNWSEIVEPKIVINTKDKGYLDYNSITEKYLKQRFAKGSLRMQIFDRDNYRCKICGSSPDNDRHATIEVHHIKPWEEGGITSPDNLITLCKLCHDNVIYADRYMLYKKIGINFTNQNHYVFNNFDSYSYKQRTQLLHYIHNSVTLKINQKQLVKIL